MTCVGCANSIPPKRGRGGPPQKWCSESCRVRSYRNRDVEKARAVGRARHHASYVRTRYQLGCVTCGMTFAHSRRTAKYCSPACRYRQHYLGRYARRVGAEREPYTLREIAARDSWVCGICGGQVVECRRYPDPGTASIDHVIPLARGGTDLKSNVQLAHLLCNWRKNDRMSVMDGVYPDRGMVVSDGGKRACAEAG